MTLESKINLSLYVLLSCIITQDTQLILKLAVLKDTGKRENVDFGSKKAGFYYSLQYTFCC